MTEETAGLDLDEELLILLFWAYGRDVSKRLGAEKIKSIEGLERAIEAISSLPSAIGWDGRDFRKEIEAPNPDSENP